jgi:hypothetical protein
MTCVCLHTCKAHVHSTHSSAQPAHVIQEPASIAAQAASTGTPPATDTVRGRAFQQKMAYSFNMNLEFLLLVSKRSSLHVTQAGLLLGLQQPMLFVDGEADERCLTGLLAQLLLSGHMSCKDARLLLVPVSGQQSELT